MTQSEATPPEVLDEFDKTLKFLSELPTERAMKDIEKGKFITEPIKKVVQTMFYSKMDIVKALRFMNVQNNSLLKDRYAMKVADKAMADFVAQNPDYEINITKK